MRKLCAALLILPLIAAANPSVLNDLEHRLKPIQSLSARFQQTVYAADGYPVQETSGEMKLARPGKIRWISSPPYEQWVIADGKTLWIYDPDLQQVTVKPFVEDISNTPAVLFIGGAAQLESHFSVEVSQSGAVTRYTLKPLQADSRYTQLVLSFADSKPSAMTLLDTLGQRTEISLNEVTLNAAIDNTLFNFTPPAGTDVLREN
ncbi:MAG: outer membrane lipoprotein chaperone LolA [Porticoccaceae bacterium]